MPYDYRKLKAGREGKGWNQTELSERMKVSSALIGMIERGERQHPPTIKLFASKVGIDLADIVISDREFDAMRAEDAEVRTA